jgi:hypothetical protein
MKEAILAHRESIRISEEIAVQRSHRFCNPREMVS